MISQSYSFWLIMRLSQHLGHFFKHSLMGRAFFALANFVGGLWKQSYVRHVLLGDFGLQKGFDKGFTGKTLNRLGNAAVKTSSVFSAPVGQSLIISWLCGLGGNLLHISLRSFGLALFLMGAIPTGISFALHGYVPLLLGLAAAAGLPFMFINRSTAQMYNGSFFAQLAGRFFFVQALEEEPVKHYLALFAVMGLAFGAAAYLLSLTTLVFLIGGLIGGLLILHRVEVGIFAAAFLMPLIPTMLTLGLLAATTASFAIKVFVTGKIQLKFTSLDAFVLVFAAIVAYSLVISYNTAASAPVAAVYLLYLMFYFVVKNTITTREKLFGLVSVIATSGLAVAAFGVWQRLTGNFTMTAAWLDMQFFDETMVRIYSTLENPNVLGKYLIFIILIAFAMIYYFEEYFHKTVAAGILAVAAGCMLFTQSRGAWLGAILALGVFALLRDRRLVVLGVIGLIIAPFFIPAEVLTRFLSIGDLADTSTNFRLSIWLASLEMIRVFWPIGIGLGTETFVMLYNLYAFSAAHALHTHNLYLQLIVDLGIAGLGVFFLIISGFLKGLFVQAAYGADRAMQTLAAALPAAMLGFLLQGLTDNVWYNYRILGFFWLVVALGAAASQYSIRRGLK